MTPSRALRSSVSPSKRKAESLPYNNIRSPKKSKTVSPASGSGSGSVSAPALAFVAPPPPSAITPSAVALVPATLTFSFDTAKSHLIQADPRFHDFFTHLPCKPFEHLEHIQPFHALVSSILGQQISWMAARSIKHKFLRLYDPTIPEDHAQYDSKDASSSFPHPSRVAGTEIATLRTAGLSARKAEYIKDLAERFSDGRLSTEKLLDASDEDLSEMLIAVRGIGPWTVDMFAIFSLRRPNILPVGDLGVQRGLLRWVLAMNCTDFNISVESRKLPGQSNEDKEKEKSPDQLPRDIAESSSPDVSTIVPTSSAIKTPTKSRTKKSTERPELPVPLTPTTKRILTTKHSSEDALPPGLTVVEMKARLSGKKKIKGALLTPSEMEHLTEAWKPYRSLGVYYMWSLTEET